jgi:hypothetical protein
MKSLAPLNINEAADLAFGLEKENKNICINNNCCRVRVRVMVLHHIQNYYSHIVAVSFIGGGDRSTQRKPTRRVMICSKSLTNFII